MRRQKGVTLSGVIMWAIVFIFFGFLGLRIGPSYFEYFTIQKQFKGIANDSEARSGARRDVELAFTKRSLIEDMKAITAKDLVITKEADGIVISAEYTTCVPVAYNLRACMDFSPSSR
jgi:hypothetical protein